MAVIDPLQTLAGEPPLSGSAQRSLGEVRDGATLLASVEVLERRSQGLPVFLVRRGYCERSTYQAGIDQKAGPQSSGK